MAEPAFDPLAAVDPLTVLEAFAVEPFAELSVSMLVLDCASAFALDEICTTAAALELLFAVAAGRAAVLADSIALSALSALTVFPFSAEIMLVLRTARRPWRGAAQNGRRRLKRRPRNLPQ